MDCIPLRKQQNLRALQKLDVRGEVDLTLAQLLSVEGPRKPAIMTHTTGAVRSPARLLFAVIMMALAVTASLADGAMSRYIVIDAGSSGCRVHVYKLSTTAGQALPTVELPDKKLKKSPGLSTFAKNPGDAGASLAGLLEFAEQHVPADERPKTPIRLAATAGLRLLPKETADAILDSCYAFLKEKSTFHVTREKISVISGRDEGAYGWLSINFLLNRLHGMSAESEGTMGSIEMGGASSQVTVQLKGDAALVAADPTTTFVLQVAGQKYTLYTHSYLGFGQEQARSRYNSLLKGPGLEDPCFNKGYSVGARSADTVDKRYDQYSGRTEGDFTGGGNFTACSAAIDELFMQVDPALKLSATCAAPPCAFGGVHQPRFWEVGNGARPATSSAARAANLDSIIAFTCMLKRCASVP